MPALLAPLALVSQQVAEEAGDDVVAGSMDASEQRDVFCALWESTAAILSEGGGHNRRSEPPPPASLVLADESDGRLPTRALSKMLAQGMGKKESNKLVRNRAEDLLTSAEREEERRICAL